MLLKSPVGTPHGGASEERGVFHIRGVSRYVDARAGARARNTTCKIT